MPFAHGKLTPLDHCSPSLHPDEELRDTISTLDKTADQDNVNILLIAGLFDNNGGIKALLVAGASIPTQVQHSRWSWSSPYFQIP